MTKISVITSDVNQVFRLTISSGKYIDVTIRYVAQQTGWFISFDYGNFSLSNFRIITSGNFLHQFRNLIPFGLSCVVENNQEPMLQKDFSSGRAIMYYLNSDEVAAYTKVISGQTTT